MYPFNAACADARMKQGSIGKAFGSTDPADVRTQHVLRHVWYFKKSHVSQAREVRSDLLSLKTQEVSMNSHYIFHINVFKEIYNYNILSCNILYKICILSIINHSFVKL